MVLMKHIALQMDSKVHAEQFYKDLLHAQLVKEFQVSPDLVKQIFNIDILHDVTVMVFEIKNQQFEVFISTIQQNDRFDHVCLGIDDVSGFLSKCREFNLSIYRIPKGEKELVFIKDFCGNLFEIKEK